MVFFTFIFGNIYFIFVFFEKFRTIVAINSLFFLLFFFISYLIDDDKFVTLSYFFMEKIDENIVFRRF